MRISLFLLTLLSGAIGLSNIALAAEAVPIVLMLQNKQFDPQHLILATGVKLKIVIRNLDAIPAEFESYDLSREVVIPAHGEVSIYIGPLDPGTYQFFNDFNHDMQGSIEARPVVTREN